MIGVLSAMIYVFFNEKVDILAVKSHTTLVMLTGHHITYHSS